jgi:hypothetical protein
MISDSGTPRPYEQWRRDPFGRAEDAAYTFGYDLIRYCRTEALKDASAKKLPKSAQEFQEKVAAAVDTALHNLMDMLEGYLRTDAGPNHRVEYVLSVCVAPKGEGETMPECIRISPCLLDLQIGYWKWKGGEFR